MAGINIQTLLLIYLPLCLGELVNDTSLENTTVAAVATTTEEPPATYQFIIKLVFGLENEKVPEFLIQTMYENPNVTSTRDVISLYTLNTINLSSTIGALEKLQYKPYKILNIEGLEIFLRDFGVAFKDFYNAVFIKNLDVTGLPLRKFLLDLGINTGEFSDAITFGDPDPLQIFKKGNFSEEFLVGALEGMGKTIDDLFDACRDAVIDNIEQKTTEEFINILSTYKFDKPQAILLWDILELKVENAENVTVFSNLLDDLKFTLENNSYLGLLTSNKVAINRNVHENIMKKMQLSKLFAQSLYDNTSAELKVEKPYYENIVTLRLESHNFTTFREVATTTKDLERCHFVTLENDTLTSTTVAKASYKKNSIEVSAEELNITELIPGSPLICNNKVYGLAKEIDERTVVFDTFIVSSGAGKFILNPILAIVCVLIYFKL